MRCKLRLQEPPKKRRGRKAVDSGGLEIPSRIPAPRQINTLAYSPVPRFSLIWAVLAAKCATECATPRIFCNSLRSRATRIRLDYYCRTWEPPYTFSCVLPSHGGSDGNAVGATVSCVTFTQTAPAVVKQDERSTRIVSHAAPKPNRR
jgi:hypothetical protein